MSEKSNGQTHDPREAQNFELRKIWIDSEKQLVTVSSASLVLLATFLKDLFRDPKWDILVGITFAALLVTLLTGVFVLMFYPLHLVEKDVDEGIERFFSITITSCFIVSIMSFFIGVTSLALFGLRNFYA